MPRQGPDEYGALMLVLQSLPDGKYVLLDDFLVDVRLRPQRFEDFLVGYETAGMLDQVAQDVEGLRCESHPLIAAPHALVDGVEPKRMKRFHAEIVSSVARQGRETEFTPPFERRATKTSPMRHAPHAPLA